MDFLYLRQALPLPGWDQLQQEVQVVGLFLRQLAESVCSAAELLLPRLHHGRSGLSQRVSGLQTKHLVQVSSGCLGVTWKQQLCSAQTEAAPGLLSPGRLTLGQERVHVEQVPASVSAVRPHQSGGDEEGVAELLLRTRSGAGHHHVLQEAPAELMQPITEQLPRVSFERQDVFDDIIGVDVECCHDVIGAFLQVIGRLTQRHELFSMVSELLLLLTAQTISVWFLASFFSSYK